ncbi:L-type lectin-domain containing receptor kinase IV.1-like [Asparagus officinalis]|uniref:L-type lectin-domain containing receptor kinase IV.1-like n=1 Tax=Asparagus officinalis TaxID=4686 RepID=UPI00098DE75D|nr:L-type lectin-domain containing receptor kinase IV.1-like [Asparagus officinalis]
MPHNKDFKRYLKTFLGFSPFARMKISSVLMKTFFFFFFFVFPRLAASREHDFTFNGFSNTDLSIDGIASVTPDGLLELTNKTQNMRGHAFYPRPLRFKSATGRPLSFSTTFVFAILSEVSDLSGQGIAFFVSHTANLSLPSPSQYLGLFTESNNGNSSNHIVAVEFDTIQNPEFQDINDNHVGIDINGLISNKSSPAGYYNDSTDSLQNLTLISGNPMQAWVDFDGEAMQINVTLSPMGIPKPRRPLLSSTIDLSSVMLDSMHVGFSSSDGPFHTQHYILGWSFKTNGVARPLDYSKLPSLPVLKTTRKSVVMVTSLAIVSCLFVLFVAAVTFLIVRRRNKYAEVLEDWELDYGPHRFSYKDLFQATKGFKEENLLGTGGFGRVYKGELPNSKMEIAVKKISHDSRQGMREFVAEIVSIGQLRHRNLVQLLGYCRRKGEFLLVYDFMANGSLDKFLYGKKNPTVNWAQRFRIIKGVASGLLYLHEDWEQVVLHRDIKASNVLLDGDFTGKLGDFGLAKLYDRGSDPQTTRIVGTMGYLAPELPMTGKGSTMTDVFAFGVFLFEVVCGRRPIEFQAEAEDLILVDWVLENWKRGLLMETVDQRLTEYCVDEVELVLKLALLCSHPMPEVRPNMRQVVQILDGAVELPELLPRCMSFSSMSLYQKVGFDNYIMSLTSSASTLPAMSGGR